ncbi:hypothetical protein HYT45_00915 [Candidatus Uhrbacteria bacterium]|nr:hypothetical protein [Candidatus Uhrbacteria bacterium]
MDQIEEKSHEEPAGGHAHGAVLFGWSVPEYVKYDRGPFWYVGAAIAAALLLFYAFRTGNFLFAVILVMFGIIMFLNSVGAPHEVRFELTERGIIWGNKYYPYLGVRGFWVVYQPPEIKNLYIEFKSALKPRLQVPLLDQNPVAIREALKKVAREDTTRADEPLSDFLGRVLKL